MMNMDKEKFEKFVRNGVSAIPKKFLEKLDNVDICIENEPNAFQMQKLKMKNNSLILGLYEGTPQIKRGNYAQTLPDKITIFKKSIEQVAKSEDEIEEIIKDTVWHEIAHHFGLNEDEVRQAEIKRKNKEITN